MPSNSTSALSSSRKPSLTTYSKLGQILPFSVLEVFIYSHSSSDTYHSDLSWAIQGHESRKSCSHAKLRVVSSWSPRNKWDRQNHARWRTKKQVCDSSSITVRSGEVDPGERASKRIQEGKKKARREYRVGGRSRASIQGCQSQVRNAMRGSGEIKKAAADSLGFQDERKVRSYHQWKYKAQNFIFLLF